MGSVRWRQAEAYSEFMERFRWWSLAVFLVFMFGGILLDFRGDVFTAVMFSLLGITIFAFAAPKLVRYEIPAEEQERRRKEWLTRNRPRLIAEYQAAHRARQSRNPADWRVEWDVGLPGTGPLRDLAKDEHFRVALASSTDSGYQLLKKLAGDESEAVRAAAEKTIVMPEAQADRKRLDQERAARHEEVSDELKHRYRKEEQDELFKLQFVTSASHLRSIHERSIHPAVREEAARRLDEMRSEKRRE